MKPPLLPFSDAEMELIRAGVIGAKEVEVANVTELVVPVVLLYVEVERAE